VICIAIISNPKKFSGKLTRFFTGSPAYHIGFVDTERGKFYDMNLLFRRREWPHYDADQYRLYQCPVDLTADDLEWWLDTDNDWYGVLDYLAFVFKKLLPNRPSFKGAICSEKVEEILKWKGWISPFDWTPSPADFERELQPI
jgi:hypothetical protein